MMLMNEQIKIHDPIAFSTVGCSHEEHPACKKLNNEVMACLSVLSEVQVVQLMPLPLHHLLLH